MEDAKTLLMFGNWYLDKIRASSSDSYFYRVCYAEFNRFSSDDLEATLEYFSKHAKLSLNKNKSN